MVEAEAQGPVVEIGRRYLEKALDILAREYGRALEYARAVVADGLGDVAVALLGGRPIGAEIFYKIRLAVDLCVHYYVAVLREYRGRGVGKTLVTTVERVCKADAYAATTTEDNAAAKALFGSLGYVGYRWRELDKRTRDVLLRATCGYDDDIIFLKGPAPREVAAEVGDAERFGHRECYLVWLGVRRVEA